MRLHILMTFLVLTLARAAVAGLDKTIVQQAAMWKKGDPPPARLLKFPDGKIDPPMCGLRVYGEAVDDYIAAITNVDLLEAILLAASATEESSIAAARQIIRLRGPAFLAARIAEQDSSAYTAPHIAVLRELLRSPLVAVKVARIEFKDVPQPQAEKAFDGFRSQLDSGVPWDQAYKTVSEAHPDPASRPYGTLVSYLFDSVVSPSGFDILTYSVARELPLQHIRELFRSRPRTVVMRTPEAIYLYLATAYSNGAG